MEEITITPSKVKKRLTYKKNKKSTKKIKKRVYKENQLVRSVFGGFTPILKTTLKYVDYATLDAGTVTAAVNVYRVNNPYDPDYTGTGHQPMWWDTYSAIYNQVRVLKANIKVTHLFNKFVNVGGLNASVGTTSGTFSNYGNANERGSRMFIIRDATSTDYPSDISTLIEQGSTNFTWCFAPQNTHNKMTVLKYVCVPHKQTDAAIRDVQLSMSTTGTTPTDFRDLYFIVGISSLDSENNPFPAKVMVEIDYEVEFFDRKTNQSQQ